MKKAVFLVLILAGCAPAPAPSPVPAPEPVQAPAPPPVPAGPPPLPQSRLVCEVPVRKIPLTDLGMPEGSRPRDVALTRGTIWILFEPNVLVGLPRQARPEGSANAVSAVEGESEILYGLPGDVWETLSVSPRDGTIWIASASAGKLWRKPPVGRVRPVQVPQLKEGGFRDLLAEWDGVYVVPTACDIGGMASVWKVDAAGKVLGTGLPVAAGAGSCPTVDLETDWSGRSWALLPESGEVFHLEGGRWVPGKDLAAPGPWPERAGPFRGWFFWGTEPVGLGGNEETPETVLVRKSEPFREDCGAGNLLLRVVGDGRGWVALTRDWLLLGEHALESKAGSSD